MKKRLFLICTILLVVALAIFAFTACDKDSEYGVELVITSRASKKEEPGDGEE